MRWMRYLIFFIMLVPSQVLAQQHSEAVCLLLQQQIDRYANHKSNPNYRSARREYDKYCYTASPRRQMPVKAEPALTPAPQMKVDAKPVAAATVAEPIASEIITQRIDTPIETQQTANSVPTVEDESASLSQAEPDVVMENVVNTANDTETAAAQPITKATSVIPTRADTAEEKLDLDSLLLEILSATPLVAANIVAFLLVVFLLTNWLGLNLPGFKGVFAEYKLNRLLRWRLSKEYQHFRKLRLTNANNETTVIDHLVLSPYGIFVIMVKGYRGRISGSESQANWTRDYLGNSKQFMNPLHQNFKNMQALQQLLELPGFELMHSVIAFARVGQFASELPANITYIDTTSNYIKQCTERCIKDEQLARFAAVIQQVVNDA